MDDITVDGVMLTYLKRIRHPKGDILHGIKASDHGFLGFGEAYFTHIAPGAIKGWNRHQKMTLNLMVPVGAVQFVLYDDRKESGTFGNFMAVRISVANFQRLTVPPGVWMSFKGLGDDINLILNVADMEHDPMEKEARELDEIHYEWEVS